MNFTSHKVEQKSNSRGSEKNSETKKNSLSKNKLALVSEEFCLIYGWKRKLYEPSGERRG